MRKPRLSTPTLSKSASDYWRSALRSLRNLVESKYSEIFALSVRVMVVQMLAKAMFRSEQYIRCFETL